MRTYKTYSAGEENKEGSEYEVLWIDDRLRNNKGYEEFARKLVARRLAKAGYTPSGINSETSLVSHLDDWCESPSDKRDRFAVSETKYVVGKYVGRERPYVASLRQKLNAGLESRCAPGVRSADDIALILRAMQTPDFPYVEKLNIFLLYRAWASDTSLIAAAKHIHRDCIKFIKGQRSATAHSMTSRYFKSDLLAQLNRDCDRGQKYVGMDTLINMSWGLPRHLLILLKYTFTWAVFNGEQSSAKRVMSAESQEAGVLEASDWFYRDAHQTGPEGSHLQSCITRLGTLCRALRFSDKPPECAISGAFSCDVTRASEESRKMLELAQKWSVLVNVGLQRDRNSSRVDLKLQLNRMLAPRWDLSIFQRGVLALAPNEVNAIFDSSATAEFEDVLKARVARATAPHFGRREDAVARKSDAGPLLPGLEHD